MVAMQQYAAEGVPNWSMHLPEMAKRKTVANVAGGT
jgi:hypothetical protein